MTEAVFQFKAIARKLNRQEQKAEFEEKNPPVPDTSMYGWPYGAAVSVTSDSYTPPEWLLNQVPLSDLMGSTEAGRLTGILTGGASTPMLGAAELPPYTPSQGVAVPFDAKANLHDVLDQVRADIDRVTGLSSLAHPEWPYTGSPHEWPKFKI
jgi:hypothetical protein